MKRMAHQVTPESLPSQVPVQSSNKVQSLRKVLDGYEMKLVAAYEELALHQSSIASLESHVKRVRRELEELGEM